MNTYNTCACGQPKRTRAARCRDCYLRTPNRGHAKPQKAQKDPWTEERLNRMIAEQWATMPDNDEPPENTPNREISTRCLLKVDRRQNGRPFLRLT